MPRHNEQVRPSKGFHSPQCKAQTHDYIKSIPLDIGTSILSWAAKKRKNNGLPAYLQCSESQTGPMRISMFFKQFSRANKTCPTPTTERILDLDLEHRTLVDRAAISERRARARNISTHSTPSSSLRFLFSFFRSPLQCLTKGGEIRCDFDWSKLSL